jgi:uroporphyrinogen decarboxylase|tara:strand:- start:1185 stop:2195 length:1011 start_codon:yes stop_codon:yes gene_type:complete
MNKFQNFLKQKNNSFVPVWFMRQAGRYLPEFRKIRKENPNFIDLCLNSKLSSEITLQPIKRFNVDAAIIFSDILIVPYTLNQNVVFEKKIGPILSDFNIENFLKNNKLNFINKLNPVYEAIRITRKNLDKKKSLIAFVGAPWTLLVYMFGLKTKEDKLDIDKYNKKISEINIVLDKLIEYLKFHINKQVEAGADIVQIFDSWAGLIPDDKINKYCYQPNLELFNFCLEKNIPTILFPKGINKKYLEFVNVVKPQIINIDYNLNPEWAAEKLNGVCIQGGMNPNILLKDEKEIFKEAERYLKIFKDYPYIFNLGHGLLPETNPDKVSKLIKFVRGYR